MKKEFKRTSEFSRSSRTDSFSDVSRGREVIVRRESLSSTSSSLDPRQVKERYVCKCDKVVELFINLTIIFFTLLVLHRYERPSSTSSYAREREIRRSDPETHRSSRDTHTRYSDSFKPPGSSTPRKYDKSYVYDRWY